MLSPEKGKADERSESVDVLGDVDADALRDALRRGSALLREADPEKHENAGRAGGRMPGPATARLTFEEARQQTLDALETCSKLASEAADVTADIDAAVNAPALLGNGTTKEQADLTMRRERLKRQRDLLASKRAQLLQAQDMLQQRLDEVSAKRDGPAKQGNKDAAPEGSGGSDASDGTPP